MKQTQSRHPLHRCLSLVLMGLILTALLLSPLSAGSRASAQEPTGNAWTAPVNLSNSGSATNPLILVDAENVTHVMWLDEFSGYQYSSTITGTGAQGEWTEPVSVSVPFGEFHPQLLMGANELVYAFWIDDVRGALDSSRVASQNLGVGDAWEPRRQLTLNTIAFDASIDEEGNVHLVYVTNADTELQPAGVYYRQQVLGGGWTSDKPIYTSRYFRGLVRQDARLSVAASAADPGSGERMVYVGWDDPALDKVFTRVSTDSGETWEAALEVDPVSQTTSMAKRYDIDVSAWNDQAVLVWKRQLSETSCEYLYQVSSGGQDWSAPASVMPEATGCPASSGFLALRSDVLIWQADINDQIVLVAFDGSRWSEPQIQTGLSGVKDLVTGRALSLGCRRLFYQASDNSVHAVGCDLDGNQDIWVTQRALEEAQAWFPPPSAWNAPVELSQSPRGLESLNILADSQGNFHALWAQPSQPAVGEQLAANASDVVHYAGWASGTWSEPASVTGERSQSANEMTAAIDAANNLLVIWRGDQACQIFFSRAPASRGFSSAEWMVPASLPAPSGTCSTPSLAVAAPDTVYAAYAVAINEGRGVYINRSLDGGRTWEAPVRVFDGQSEQWEMVDHPVMAVSGSRLHLLWRHGSLHRPGQAQGLGYAYSDDAGATWSAAETIQGELRWAGLASSAPAAGGSALLRVWELTSADQPVIVTQVSTDDGENWSAPVSIASFGEILGSPALLAGTDGTMHLIQASRDYMGKVFLRHWLWYNDSWAAGDSLELTAQDLGSILDLSAVISNQQQLAVIFAESEAALPSGENPRLQVITGAAGLSGEIPEALPAAQPTLAPTPETPAATADPAALPTEMTAALPTETAAAVVQPTEDPGQSVTPDPTFATDPSEQDGPEEPASSNTWTGLILGIVLAVVIVIGVFGFRIAQTKA